MHTLTLLIAGALLAGTARAQDTALDLARARLARPSVEAGHRALAFYYPWYATPAHTGVESHWGNWDAERHDAPASLRWPAGGPYDSRDPAVIARHVEQLAAAGLDGAIASWWGPGLHCDFALSALLDAAEPRELVACAYYEVVPGEPPTPASAAADLAYLARHYAKHPAWLRAGGRPVLFVYVRALEQLGALGWVEALERCRAEEGVDWFVVADRLDEEAAVLFDGVHTYNPMGLYLEREESEWRGVAAEHLALVAALSRARGRLGCATVVPGYDDTKIREPGVALDRAEGRLYAAQWEACAAQPPDWVLVTSFNEWHEGSEIEPSLELGDAYLAATRRGVERWRAALAEHGGAATSSPPPDAGRATRLARLRAAFTPAADPEDGTPGEAPAPVGLLGGLGRAGLALIEAGVPVQLIGPARLASGELPPEHFRWLLYVGGEHYPMSVARELDVPNALDAWLSAGGSLLVLGNEPVPFFYDARDRPVEAGLRFGLALCVGPDPSGAVGFEAPPRGSALRFVVDPSLTGLPRELPFPSAGDRRFRPMVSPAEDARFTPLVRLVDGEESSLGAAAGLVEREGGGRLVYAWFRLADAVPLETLLAALVALDR